MALLSGMFPSGGGLFGGMLEDGGPGGYGRLTPEAEAQLALEARQRAAAIMRAQSGARGTADMSLFQDQAPSETLTQQMMRLYGMQGPQGGGFAPQGMPQAAPQMGPQSMAPQMPAPTNVPSMRVASPEDDRLPPNATPTAGRAPPGMTFSAQQVAPAPMPQMGAQPDRLNAALGSFGGAPTLGGALMGGLFGAITGQRNDPYGQALQNEQLTAKTLYEGLMANGMDHKQALAIATTAAVNPEIAKQILPGALGPKEPPKTMEEAIARQVDAAIKKGGAGAVPEKLMQIYNDFVRQKQAAEAQGKTTGEAQGTAQAGLPDAITKAQTALDIAERLKTHPGREGNILGSGGVGGTLSPLPAIPGTPTYDFQTLLGQAKSGTFLEAYKTLKGGGAISNVEGGKAEAAIARLDRAQTKVEFDQALNDYVSVIKQGLTNQTKIARGEMQPFAEAQQTITQGGWTHVAPGIRIRERQ